MFGGSLTLKQMGEVKRGKVLGVEGTQGRGVGEQYGVMMVGEQYRVKMVGEQYGVKMGNSMG